MGSAGVWGRRFGLILALIVVAGGALRVVYVETVTRGDHRFYDAKFYELEARSVVTGGGWIQPVLAQLKPPVIRQTAEHPPATVVALMPAALIDDPDLRDLAMRLTMVAIGCGTILLVGLIGRSVAGPGVGLLAAAIAVVDPNLWMNDGIVMSEALATLIAAALILLGYRAWRGDTSWKVAAGLGGLAAVGTLTRSELLFLVPLLVVPALVVGSRRARSTAARRGAWLGPVAVSVVCCGLVLAPWTLYNLSRFEKTTTLSTTVGLSIRSANCDVVYSGSLIGFTGILYPKCVPVNPARHGAELSVHDARLRRMGIQYLSDHLDRLPVVTAARLGRAFYLFKIDQTMQAMSLEGRPIWAQWSGAVVTWILLPLSVVGWAVLRRRRTPTWPLLAPLVAVVSAFLLVAGFPRYRAAGEPTLLVLTAVAMVFLAERLTRSAAEAPPSVPVPVPS